MKTFLNFVLSLIFLFSNTTFAQVITADAINGKVKVAQEFLNNGNAEGVKNPWSCYNDGAVARPVDGTGGTTSLASTIVRSAANTVFGLNTSRYWSYTHPSSNVQGQGCSIPFKVAQYKDGASLLQIEAEYQLGSIGFVNGTTGTSPTDSDVIFYIYDVTAGKIIEPDSFKIVDASAFAVNKLVTTFQTTYGSTDYRLIFHNATTTTTPFVFNFRASVTKPTPVPNGVIITPWVNYSPTLTTSGGGAVTLNTTSGIPLYGKWRQVGDTIEISYGFRNGTGGVGTGSAGNLKIDFPAGVVYDPVVNSSPSDGVLGSYLGPANGSYNGTSSSSYQVYSGFITPSNSNGTVTVASLVAGYALTGFAKFKVQGWNGTTNYSSSTPTSPVTFIGTQVGSSQAVTAATTDIAFTSSKDTNGCWNGTQCTVRMPGDYTVTLIAYSVSSTMSSGVYVNGSLRRYLAFHQTNVASGGSVTIPDLKVGDIVSVRAFQSVTIAGDALQSLSIIRVNGGATSTNQDTSVAAIYSTNSQTMPGSATTIVNYDTKEYDNGGRVTTGAAWKFTADRPGMYEVTCFNILSTGGSWSTNGEALTSLFKNGSQVARIADWIATTATSAYPTLVCTPRQVPLNTGDYIDVRITNGQGTNLPMAGGVFGNWISIKRVGNL